MGRRSNQWFPLVILARNALASSPSLTACAARTERCDTNARDGGPKRRPVPTTHVREQCTGQTNRHDRVPMRGRARSGSQDGPRGPIK
jgi:hypothetical protein